MEVSDTLPSQVSVDMSTVVIVKNRCQFCYAFFKDPEKIVEHSNRCSFRFSETFEAFDGKVKFACAVCFDVFQTRAEHAKHEQLHKFPGGFPCTICGDTFLNDLECVHHMENDHEIFKTGHDGGYSASACYDCGAFFEQQSYLRLHNETDCGRHRRWHCIQCGPNLLTEDAYKTHMDSEHKSVNEEDDNFMMPTVEVTLNKNHSIIPIGNISKKDDLSEDPLLFVLKDEKYYDENIENLQIMTEAEDEDMYDVNKSLAKETSTEAPRTQSAASNTFNADYIPKIGIGEKYECKYCDKKYITKGSFDQHTIKHGPDGKLVHRCDCCDVYFPTRKVRDLHMKIEHEDKLTCKICHRFFRSVGALHAHERIGHNVREEKAGGSVDKNASKMLNKSECELSHTSAAGNPIDGTTIETSNCDGDDAASSKIRKKSNIKPASEKKFKCKYCEKKFFTENGLERHIEDHGPDGSLVHRCDCCTTYFKTTEERDMHSQTAHKEKAICKICNQTFRSLARLQNHERVYHPGGKPKLKRKKPAQNFFCVKCGTRFTNKSYLEEHEQSDCGRAPRYKCDACGKCLANKSSLKIHVMLHTDVRNYACNYCGKTFRHRGGLRLHIRYQHTNERPHKCDKCDKSFVDLTSLKVHMTIHTGIKRYVCYGCGERYPTNSALHKHRNARKNTCALVPMQPPLKMAES